MVHLVSGLLWFKSDCTASVSVDPLKSLHLGSPMNVEDVLKQYAAGVREFETVNLNEANLSGANLSHINLSGANLSVANLSSSNLSQANLSHAKLNVAKLSGANLSRANLSEANLNVANLALADLSHADLSQASLVRAELTRADLSHANLNRVNLNGADLKDAKLRNTNLAHANLSRADLRWAKLTTANLTQANLHGADLSSADFSGADLSNTELRQANLSRANFSGANLSGTNLRWADLSGADLRWADLSNAKLSGANLTGANLSHATLFATSLVHVDLTRANLMSVDWAGADLSGATLTGAKLYDVLRFGIKTDGIVCDWIDLSPNGDQSQVYRVSADTEAFFHEAPPTVRLVIDAQFDQAAHCALAVVYRQLAKYCPVELHPPNLQVGRRRTTLVFEMEGDEQLFLTAYMAILPFGDAIATHKHLKQLLDCLHNPDYCSRFRDPTSFASLSRLSQQLLNLIAQLKLSDASQTALKGVKFFQAPTRTTLINSSNQILNLHSHPLFGKRMIDQSGFDLPLLASTEPVWKGLELETIVEFVQGFHFPSTPDPSVSE